MTDQDPFASDATQVVPMPEPLVPTSAPVEPVSTPTGPKSSRRRWAVALGGAAIVVAITAAIVFALVGRSPDAAVLGYVPSGTVAYAEVRLDLPGDQRREIGEFLSKFPGFADQTALDTKLDEVLDQVVAEATKGEQTFTDDIKPWFDGELAVSAGPLPDPKAITGQGAGKPDLGHGLALLSIKDAAGAQAWFDAAFKKAGATTTTESYGGATLTIFGEGDGPKAAFAIVDGKVAVAGAVDSVKAAVDTKGNGGFAQDPNTKAALASASGDHLGFAYVALEPLLAWTSELGGGAAVSPMSSAALEFVPDWGAYWLRVEGDALVMEATAPKAESTLGPTEDRVSDVARHVPSSAIALSVTHDVGATLQQVLDLYATELSLKPITDAIKEGLGVVGGAEAALGWMGDAGIVVNQSGDAAEGGLVVLTEDPDKARELFTSAKNLAALAGVAGVTFRDVDHGGTPITVVSLDLAQVMGAVPGAVPSAFAMPIDKIELAWAVTDDYVVVGSGQAFVEHVLDTTDATSLASNDRYEALIGRVGPGTGSAFVDITAIRTFLEGLMAKGDVAALKQYETDVKPYLEPFDAMIASSSVGGDVTRSRVVITVK